MRKVRACLPCQPRLSCLSSTALRQKTCTYSFPIKIFVVYTNRVRGVNIHDGMKNSDDESIFRSFYTQKPCLGNWQNVE